MSADELRSAAILLAGEGAPAGEPALRRPEVRAAVRPRPVPWLPRRVLDRLRLGRGIAEDAAAQDARAREAALGDRAAGPPHVLLRVDEFPNVGAYDAGGTLGTRAFERFHGILAEAGCDYMIAALPRVPRASHDPSDRDDRPLEAGEREVLSRLSREGVEIAVHGHDHRTRDARPRHHSELIGLSPGELSAKLDASDAALSEAGIVSRSFVAPFNRFSADQFTALAERYEIVCGGPETVMQMGFQPTPRAREGTIYVPAYAPLYGRAREVRPALERLAELNQGAWAPVVLHWSWELADDDFAELRRLAELLGPLSVPWQTLIDAAAIESGMDAADSAAP